MSSRTVKINRLWRLSSIALSVPKALLLIGVLLPSVSYSETLLEMYQLALKNDPQLKVDQALYESSREIVKIERSSALPQINGSAAYSSSNTDTSIDLDEDDSADVMDFTVSLEQSLLNLATANNIKRGKVEEQLADLALAQAKQDLIVRTTEAYFNLLSALDQLVTSQAETDALNIQLEQTQERFDVGLVPINDVYEARAAYDSALAATIDADANVGIQREFLAIITGRYHTAIAPLIENFIVRQPEPNNRQDWIDQAVKGNLALQVDNLTVLAATYTYKATSAGRAPTLDGSLSYSHSEDLQGHGDSQTSTIGLELTIPLYTGGRLSAQKRESAQRVIQAEEQVNVSQRNTVQQTRSLFLSLQSAISLIKARQQAIISNESALQASRAGYDAGTRDITDVVNAQKNLFQAQRDYSATLYQYIIDSLGLKASAGVLSEKDLQQLETALASTQPISMDD